MKNSKKEQSNLMVVKLDNEIIDLPFGNLTAKQNDVLHILTYYSQDKGNGKRTIPIPLFRDILGLSSKDGKAVLENAVYGMYQAVSETTLVLRDSNKVIITKFFDSALIDYDNDCIVWQPGEYVVPLINNLTGNYTRLQVQGLLSLSSSYAKNIYRKLSRFKSTGIWKVSNSDFKSYLGIPKSYAQCDINKRVIEPSVEELLPYFPDLDVKKCYVQNEKKGRPAVYGYIFTFTPFDEDDDNLEEYLALKGGYEKTRFVCPICHKALYWKYFDSPKAGMTKLLCHPDFNEGCNRVFTVEELSVIASQNQEGQSEDDKN